MDPAPGPACTCKFSPTKSSCLKWEVQWGRKNQPHNRVNELTEIMVSANDNC